MLAQLRADPATCNFPVVVISTDATPHRVERLRDADAQDCPTKPINLHELLRAWCEHLPSVPAEAVGAGI